MKRVMPAGNLRHGGFLFRSSVVFLGAELGTEMGTKHPKLAISPASALPLKMTKPRSKPWFCHLSGR